MDFSFLLNLLPQPYVSYATAAVTVCAALATVVPATTKAGKVLHAIALNFGQAKPASATSAGAPVVEITPAANS